MEKMTDTFFCGKSVASVSLEDWMKWASGQADATPHVVLPMIQRGAVWAPHKLLDIWDTLLRGMPIGAMMASETVAGVSIITMRENGTRESTLGDISLIDGQQRTLSMLAGWPQGLANPLRPVAIWLDLTDAAQGEYLFRLWATTKAQPYGYARAGMGGQSLTKLERSKLKLANQAWEKLDAPTLWKQPDFMPWEAKFALPLTELIANRDRLQAFVQEQLNRYKDALENRISNPACSKEAEISPLVTKHFTENLKALPTDAVLEKYIHALKTALAKVLACKFPIIHVRRESFDDLESHSANVNIDPPLAILFKRVGTGGEPLSNADYVYSVIKHHAPEVHNTVEALLKDERIRAIYTPTTLVMSAVRLTMLTLEADDSKGQKVTDSAKLDKATFARLVRNHIGFIEEFKKAIQPDGTFVTCLKPVLEKLGYSAGFPKGLPKHAQCLIPIPLLEVIMAWHTLRKPSAEAMERSRLPMVRFVLQGNLCVQDYAKASEVAVKALKGDKTVVDYAKTSGVDVGMLKGDEFPDQVLMELLCKGDKATAYPLPSPERLKKINDLNGLPLTATPSGINGLRGWTRFSVKSDADKPYAEIYKRWWNRKGGHVHPMLLWLQRDYVFKEFEKQPALAGMDEETPFDFDHILPSAHWANWTGSSGSENKFIDYPLKDQIEMVPDSTGHRHIGNSIGNIHVLESGENRSLGDASVSVKLKKEEFTKNAHIPAVDKDGWWLKASGDEKEPRTWKIDRALAFQHAAEQRTFALYSKFYADLFQAETQCEA